LKFQEGPIFPNYCAGCAADQNLEAVPMRISGENVSWGTKTTLMATSKVYLCTHCKLKAAKERKISAILGLVLLIFGIIDWFAIVDAVSNSISQYFIIIGGICLAIAAGLLYNAFKLLSLPFKYIKVKKIKRSLGNDWVFEFRFSNKEYEKIYTLNRSGLLANNSSEDSTTTMPNTTKPADDGWH
jgi:hypothetical protein